LTAIAPQRHKDNIRFQYRCFDRILLNATIQPLQEEKRVVGFFWTYWKLYSVSRDVLRNISKPFHNWVLEPISALEGAPLLKIPTTIQKHAETNCWDSFFAQPDAAVLHSQGA
jgi:hypothetical protein